MRLSRVVTLVAVTALLAAVGAPAAHATPAREGLLYLGSGSAITAVSPDTGAVQFTKTPAIADARLVAPVLDAIDELRDAC